MSTLYDKVFDKHVIKKDGELYLLYVDRHYIHEITSPQAFEGLRMFNRSVRRPDKTFGTMDHNTPTTQIQRENITDEELRKIIKDNIYDKPEKHLFLEKSTHKEIKFMNQIGG